MDYNYILSRVAPCGLHCGKCFAFREGDIRSHSIQLKESFGNFDIYAERFVGLFNEPVFGKYPDFKEFLSHLTMVDCGGCRKEKCKLLKSCNVRECSEKKGVDFCFECDQFPCNQTGFDEHLNRRSVEINGRMKDIGVVAYYQEIKDKSRY